MIPPLQKPYYLSIAKVMRERVLNGDYALKPLPSERMLAKELGVNYMTIRRGLNMLEEDGLLERLDNGRLGVNSGKKHRSIAILVPSGSSEHIEGLRRSLEQAAQNLPCSIRAVLFRHWEDQTIRDAVEGFDGTFLYVISEPIPAPLLDFLQQKRNKVVALEHNHSVHGIPTIRPFPPVFVQKLLDHLAELGHRNIGCFNTQVAGTEVTDRINQWRYWMAAHGYSGRLIDEPADIDINSAERAYRRMLALLRDTRTPMRETAWLCITAPVAMGVMRAMQDCGLTPGKDIAVCAINGENFAAFLNPRLTALETPDIAPFFSICLQWMLDNSGPWKGPLMMQPNDVPLFVRESTLGALPSAGADNNAVPQVSQKQQQSRRTSKS